MTSPRQANRLATETSPYLIQHAHNPVDWYPWGEEALARARETDRPIFLSIGYAACHWCHVMERESFEDEATAADLARDFVAIKVDREERPDLDAVYMAAVQAMTGHGGWPMSVFLTPDGRPFYGGTYFPDRPRHGMPSFRQLLAGVAEAWRERRAEVEDAASRLSEHLRGAPGTAGPTDPRAATPVGPSSSAPTPEDARHDAMLQAVTASLARDFDPRHGGWGRAPKFPAPMLIELLLREHLRLGGDAADMSARAHDVTDRTALAMATRTLDAMAAGGIHDQLGGGFARYATDAAWLVPHFEKMLYDNAQLARVYLHAWQITGRADYRDVAVRTLDFMARELRVPPVGAFASSLDADTDGHEGATYVWTAAQIREVLGQDSPLFEAAHDVTEDGNWEGRSILSRVRDDGRLARDFDLPERQVAERLARAREQLLLRRGQRAQPARDDKVLAAWNGLALGAFAEAGRVLREERYSAIAREAADFLLHSLRTPEGRLLRSWKDGRAQHAGVLEDHAHLADGLLALYETTFEERWFDAARELADLALEHFAHPEGGFFDTADDAEALIVRPRGLTDDALPSGGAMLTCVLLKLAALTGEGRYRDHAEAALGSVLDLAPRHPAAFAQWLTSIGLSGRDIDEVAIVGDPGSTDTQALLEVVRNGHRPWQVVALAADPARSRIALLEGRERLDGRATAYVCRRFACGRPVTSAHELAAQLGRT